MTTLREHLEIWRIQNPNGGQYPDAWLAELDALEAENAALRERCERMADERNEAVAQRDEAVAEWRTAVATDLPEPRKLTKEEHARVAEEGQELRRRVDEGFANMEKPRKHPCVKCNGTGRRYHDHDPYEMDCVFCGGRGHSK